MRRLLSLMLLAAWFASPALAQQAALLSSGDEAAFVLRRDTTVLLTETFARTPGAIEAEVTTAQRARVAYAAALRPDGTVERLELRAFGSASATEPARTAVVRLTGDSAVVDVTRDGATETQRFATPPGALPTLNLSVALSEQVLRRARALGGPRVEVPVFSVNDGEVSTATVTFVGADSARIGFASGNEIHVRTDAEGRILGARGPAPGQAIERTDAATAQAAFAPPDYSAPEGAPYTAEEVRIPTAAGHVLVGTLTLPRGARSPVPAVVTITGSSRQDRDMSSTPGGPYRLFRQVADTLGRRGIAVLRMDDRGVGASTGDFESATTADRADDVRAGLAYLRARPEVDADRLGLVGISEGGLIAPMVAATDGALGGIVLLAAPASTGREIAEYQLRYAAEREEGLDAAGRDSLYRAGLAELRAEAERSPWAAFFLDYDPLPTAREVEGVPVLIVQGTTDRNVPPADAARLAEAFRQAGNADVTVRMLEGYNHVLLRDPDGDPRRYGSLPSFTVGPEVLGPVADWLAERLGR